MRRFCLTFPHCAFPIALPLLLPFFQEEIEAAKLARSKASGLWHMNEDWSIITADSFRSLSGLLSRTGELSFFGRFLPSKMTQKIHFFSWSKEWFSSKISRPNFLWRQIYKIIPTFQFVFYLFYWNKCSVILFLNFLPSNTNVHISFGCSFTNRDKKERRIETIDDSPVDEASLFSF